MSIHPRISVSQACSIKQSLDADLSLWHDLDIDRVGLLWRKLETAGADTAVAAIEREGLEVTNVIATGVLAPSDELRWGEQRDRVTRIAEVTGRLGSPWLVLTSGPLGPLHWEAAADGLAELLRPLHRDLADLGVKLAIEHTNSLRLDLSFVTSFRQAAALAVRMGCGAVLELNAAWHEQGLSESIRYGVDHLSLVQVSDYKLGTTRTPDRVVPGDGDIPLPRLLRQVIDAGFEGVFDLEVVGPRVEREGYASTIRRGVAALGALLTDLGV